MSEPIFDDLVATNPQTVAPDPTQDAEPQTVTPELPDHDDEDVKALLERETADGPGDLDKLPESDTEFDVEEEIK